MYFTPFSSASIVDIEHLFVCFGTVIRAMNSKVTGSSPACLGGWKFDS